MRQQAARPVEYLLIPLLWAAQYNTWLLIKLTPKGVDISFLETTAGCKLSAGNSQRLFPHQSGKCVQGV